MRVDVLYVTLVWWTGILVVFFVWDLVNWYDAPVWLHIVRNEHGRSVQVGSLFTFYLWQVVALVAMWISYAANEQANAEYMAQCRQLESKVQNYDSLVRDLQLMRREGEMLAQRNETLRREVDELRPLRARVIDADAARKEIARLQKLVEELEVYKLREQELHAAHETIVQLQMDVRALESQLGVHKSKSV